jgi:hypothetical protein
MQPTTGWRPSGKTFRRQTLPDFPGNAHFTNRGAVAGRTIPNPKFGSRNAVNPHRFPIFIKGHFLVGHADPDLTGGLAGRAARQSSGKNASKQGDRYPSGIKGEGRKRVKGSHFLKKI